MTSDEQLCLACQEGDLARAKQALAEGAKPVPMFDGEPSPLMYASESGNLHFVQLLIDAGADVSYKDDLGSTALECAAVAGDEQIVNFLMQLGAADNANRQGAKPSEYAEHFGHTRVAELIKKMTSNLIQKS